MSDDRVTTTFPPTNQSLEARRILVHQLADEATTIAELMAMINAWDAVQSQPPRTEQKSPKKTHRQPKRLFRPELRKSVRKAGYDIDGDVTALELFEYIERNKLPGLSRNPVSDKEDILGIVNKDSGDWRENADETYTFLPRLRRASRKVPAPQQIDAFGTSATSPSA